MLITSSNLDLIKAEAIALSYTNSSTRSSFFTQRVINTRNSLPMSVEFGSLSAFTKSIGSVNLNQILTVYKLRIVWRGEMSDWNGLIKYIG